MWRLARLQRLVQMEPGGGSGAHDKGDEQSYPGQVGHDVGSTFIHDFCAPPSDFTKGNVAADAGEPEGALTAAQISHASGFPAGILVQREVGVQITADGAVLKGKAALVR